MRVTLLHVLRPASRQADEAPGGQVMDYALEGLSYETVERRVVEGADVVSTVLPEAEGYGLIVIGATEEPLFRNLVVGNTPEQVARRVEVAAVMVKRRSTTLHSILRQTVLEPTTPNRGR